MINVDKVSQMYPIYNQNKKKGSTSLFKRYFLKETDYKYALNDVSLSINEGEFIGLLGPNGAGKSTLIKIMFGILSPTVGSVTIKGIDPIRNRKTHAKNIGILFGQRSQLWWDLPLIDSFKLLGSIYDVNSIELNKRINELTEIMDVKEFIDRPTRQLSLGERMRGELVACLLHDPPILFLDEPTIGLDIVSKQNIQAILKQINEDKKKTIILTTHNVDDIEKLCRRVVFLNYGEIIFNDNINILVDSFISKQLLVIESTESSEELPLQYEKRELNKYWVKINRGEDIYSIAYQLKEKGFPLKSISIEQPRLEDIIKNLYLKKKDI